LEMLEYDKKKNAGCEFRNRCLLGPFSNYVVLS
jgi:hypothetical protein